MSAGCTVLPIIAIHAGGFREEVIEVSHRRGHGVHLRLGSLLSHRYDNYRFGGKCRGRERYVGSYPVNRRLEDLATALIKSVGPGSRRTSVGGKG